MTLQEKIERLTKELDELQPKTLKEVEELRIHFLSRKGEIADLFEEFKKLAPEEKRSLGAVVNRVKQIATERIEQLRNELKEEKEVSHEDLTRTSDALPMGSRHPLSIVEEEVVAIFTKLGFSIARGPEIEDDYHLFSALNFPPDHPARDMQDTFFIEQNPAVLLRTHTSSVQIRIMEQTAPPIRVICPGRVYRNEAISARAHCFFHQVEALYVDKHVSFQDLRELLLFFAREFFGPDTKIRLRPSYFPFTEPSAEMDVSCNICHGKGCALCKQTGWVEILGCGMVDPNVLKNCGIDPEIYSGYALGMGIERMANLKYRCNDLRRFSENDIRFLSQFEGEH